MGKHVQRRGSRRRYPQEELKRTGIWDEEGDTDSLPPLPRGYSRRERRPRRWPAVLVTVLLILALAGVGTYRWLTAPLPPQESRLNLLVTGTDADTLNGRADTIMLFSLDWKTKTLSVLSIPRDTRVHIPGQEGWNKINAANAVGGAELMTRSVSDLLGIPVYHYARVNFDGFAKIVDILGGVVIDVEKPMNYDDFAQGLHIHLEPGKQLLNGREALEYMRFRHDGKGDVTVVDPENQVYEGRIERQQKFVAAVAQQFLQPGAIFRLPRLVGQLKGATDTDLSLPEMYKYFIALKDMQQAKVRTFTVPGESMVIDKVSYWVPDTERIPAVIKDFLAAEKSQGKAATAPEEAQPASEVVVQQDAAPEVEAIDSEAQSEYQPVIEILNGSGVDGMAARAAKVFTAKGFKVVKTENADRQNYEFSVIILRSDRVARLEEITSLIRDPAEFRPEIDPQGKVDVTIILSKKSGY